VIKWFKRIIAIGILLCAAFVGAKLSYDNGQLVSPLLIGYQLPSLPLGLWMSISLLIGCILGFFLAFFPRFFGRRSLSIRDKKIKQLENEVGKLRTSSLKD